MKRSASIHSIQLMLNGLPFAPEERIGPHLSLRQLIHKFAFMKSNLLDLLLACRAAGLLGFPFRSFIPLPFINWFRQTSCLHQLTHLHSIHLLHSLFNWLAFLASFSSLSGAVRLVPPITHQRKEKPKQASSSCLWGPPAKSNQLSSFFPLGREEWKESLVCLCGPFAN